MLGAYRVERAMARLKHLQEASKGRCRRRPTPRWSSPTSRRSWPSCARRTRPRRPSCSRCRPRRPCRTSRRHSRSARSAPPLRLLSTLSHHTSLHIPSWVDELNEEVDDLRTENDTLLQVAAVGCPGATNECEARALRLDVCGVRGAPEAQRPQRLLDLLVVAAGAVYAAAGTRASRSSRCASTARAAHDAHAPHRLPQLDHARHAAPVGRDALADAAGGERPRATASRSRRRGSRRRRRRESMQAFALVTTLQEQTRDFEMQIEGWPRCSDSSAPDICHLPSTTLISPSTTLSPSTALHRPPWLLQVQRQLGRQLDDVRAGQRGRQAIRALQYRLELSDELLQPPSARWSAARGRRAVAAVGGPARPDRWRCLGRSGWHLGARGAPGSAARSSFSACWWSPRVPSSSAAQARRNRRSSRSCAQEARLRATLARLGLGAHACLKATPAVETSRRASRHARLAAARVPAQRRPRLAVRPEAGVAHSG